VDHAPGITYHEGAFPPRQPDQPELSKPRFVLFVRSFVHACVRGCVHVSQTRCLVQMIVRCLALEIWLLRLVWSISSTKLKFKLYGTYKKCNIKIDKMQSNNFCNSCSNNNYQIIYRNNYCFSWKKITIKLYTLLLYIMALRMYI